MESLGFIEVRGVTAAIDALDIMCKTADVRFVTWERRLGGWLVTIVIEGTVSAVLSREEYYSGRGRQFVNIAYDGSLPMFIAGFVKKQKLSEKDIDEIIELLNKKR